MGERRRHSFSVPSLPAPVASSKKAIPNRPKELDNGDAALTILSTSKADAISNDPSAAAAAASSSSTNNKPPTAAGILPPRLPPRAGLPKQKSVSDESHNNNNHFLGGINLEHCSDLLSIPDPPSPSSGTAAMPRRRRQSSPMVLAAPTTSSIGLSFSKPNALKDRTNRGGATAAAARKQQGRRQSLCHVPSPPVMMNARCSDEKEETRPEDDFEQEEDDNDDQKPAAVEVVLSMNEIQPKQESTEPTPSTAKKSSSLCLDGLDDEDVPCRTSSARRKRRESMFLPSVAPSSPDEDASSETNVELSLYEDLEEDPATTSLTRRRKRQSFVLPSDSEDAGGYLEQLEECMADTQEESEPISAFSSASSCDRSEEATSSATELTESDMCNVRAMVRQYCSLPPSQRETSKQAEEIERLTGYALIRPSAKRRKLQGADVGGSASYAEVSSNDSRRELLADLGELVEIMEQKKIKDVAQLHRMTECRVERSSKTGKCRYYHVETHKSVKPKEFQERYERMLKQTKPAIRANIQEWLGHYNGVEPHDAADEKVMSTIVTSPLKSSSKRKPPPQQGEAEKAKNSEPPLSSNSSSDKPSEQEETNRGDESMDISAGDELNLPIEENEDDSSTSSKDLAPLSEGDSSSSTGQRDEGKGEEEEERSELLVPIPSRDAASSDPEIAAAEQRLWAAIDAALEQYSGEVLAIQEARRNGIAASI